MRQINIRSIDELYADVPDKYRLKKPLRLPEALSEFEVKKHVEGLLSKGNLCSRIAAVAHEAAASFGADGDLELRFRRLAFVRSAVHLDLVLADGRILSGGDLQLHVALMPGSGRGLVAPRGTRRSGQELAHRLISMTCLFLSQKLSWQLILLPATSHTRSRTTRTAPMMPSQVLFMFVSLRS